MILMSIWSLREYFIAGGKFMNDVNIKGRKCFISAVAYVHNNTKSELEYFFPMLSEGLMPVSRTLN